MFDRLFQRPRARERHRNGALLDERLRYLTHLASQGMARATIYQAAIYLLIVIDELRLAARPGVAIGLGEIGQQAVNWTNRPSFYVKRRGSRCSRTLFKRHATAFLRFLGRLQMAPPKPRPHADQIDAFGDYLNREQGLSPRTCQIYCRTAEQFLDDLRGAGHCLKEVTITQIDKALMERITHHGYARRTVRELTYALRPFFRYAYRRGWCRKDLADAIQAPRVFKYVHVPSGPSWEDVKRLLATTEGDKPSTIRARAILLLLAVYGFRRGEVVRLRLEDFDWQREVLSLKRLKTQRAQTFPLARTVGDAVLRYLRKVRPRSSLREVFLTLYAPVRPMLGHTVTSIVSKRMRALGISLTHYGAHALRHACATHLLSEGLSLKVIGDQLGHSHPDVTRAYAKVDLVGLRQVADFDLGGLQ